MTEQDLKVRAAMLQLSGNPGQLNQPELPDSCNLIMADIATGGIGLIEVGPDGVRRIDPAEVFIHPDDMGGDHD